jgi:hypothetical protein
MNRGDLYRLMLLKDIEAQGGVGAQDLNYCTTNTGTLPSTKTSEV